MMNSKRRNTGGSRPMARKPAAGMRKPAAGMRKPAAGMRKPTAGMRKPAASMRKPAAGMRKMAANRAGGPKPTTSTPVQSQPEPELLTVSAGPMAPNPMPGYKKGGMVKKPMSKASGYKKGGMVKKGAAKKPMSKASGYKKGGMVKKYRGGGCVMGKRGMSKTKKS